MRHDVIMALASGVGRSAIAVFRLSGEGTAAVLSQLCGAMPPPRHASLRRLRDRDGAALDDAIVLWLPGPASYTGEDSGELHVHGGAAVREALFRTLADFGARLAAPGEFTRRAFINGKLDLLQAEAVADLVDAETEGQRRQALRQLRGELGSLYGGWMTRLRGLLAVEEALIDFPDEALPPELETENAREISALAAALAGHLGDGRRGEHMREGIFIAVVGLPNVGKSSLVNRLAGRDVAIVTAMPGTTRDAIEVRLDLDGIPATLIDTAGLRETDDPIEREGIARALARADSADVVIELREPGRAGQSPSADRARLVVVNKIDTGAPPPGVLGISCLTGAGFDELRIALAGEAARLSGDAEGPALTRARHRTCVEMALASLIAARGTRIPELRAEELRLAVKALGEITGAVTVDALLDDLFLRFCIGK